MTKETQGRGADAYCAAPSPATPRADRSHVTLAVSGGSVLAAFLASACCVGPLIFALLGLGGAGLLVKLEPYRPYFIVLTFALLGAGFYVAYRTPRLGSRAAAAPRDGAACDCPAPRTHRAGRIMLWLATALVLGFLAFPYLVPVLFS